MAKPHIKYKTQLSSLTKGGKPCYHLGTDYTSSIFMLTGNRIGTPGEASAEYDNEDDGQGNRKDKRESFQKQDNVLRTIRQPQADPIDKQRTPDRHQHGKHNRREDLPPGHYFTSSSL